MSPRSSSLSFNALLFFAAAALTLCACTEYVPARFATASKHPDKDRRPDGVAVDLTSEPPPFRDDATTSDKVVTLRAPLAIEVAHKTIGDFFEAVIDEDIGAMGQVVQPSALIMDLRGTRNRNIHGVTSLWRHRFYKHDYRLLASRLIYRRTDVTTYRGEQLQKLPMDVRYLLTHSEASPTDIVLKVPIVTHSVKNQRVLGTKIFFWLRRDGDRYVIYRIAEDIPL